AVRSEDDEPGERRGHPARNVAPDAIVVDGAVGLERRNDRGEHACEARRHGSNCTGARPVPCTARLTARTTTKIAAAGASIHGASASIDTFAASCSIVPHVGTVSGKPRPTYESVASARMNA